MSLDRYRRMYHCLAGRCGIPALEDRVYVQVDLKRIDLAPGEYGESPARIRWRDGRTFEIEGVFGTRHFGREIFGNLVTCYTVGIRHQAKTLWHDDTGWFVERRRRS